MNRNNSKMDGCDGRAKFISEPIYSYPNKAEKVGSGLSLQRECMSSLF